MDAGQRPVVAADLRALALCFTAGVLAVHALRELPPLPILAAAALALAIPFRWRAHYAMLLLGVLLTTWQAQDLLAQRWPASRHNEEMTVPGHVVSLPELKISTDREGEPVQTWRFQFQPADPALPLTRASWYRSGQALRGGECWQLHLRMKTPHGSLNPGAFDYEAWLFRQGVGATATVKSGTRCADDRAGVLALRQRIVEQLRAWLPQHPAGALVAALTVGDDSGFSDADWGVFRLTGTAHLVAISGFNIGIVAGVAFFLCRWLWCLWPPLCLKLPAQKAGMLGSAMASAAYALLAGFEPPVVRALAMLLIVLAAAWLHRLSQPSRVLALAWLAILLFDPFAVMSPGLWLSFGAVAAMAYVALGRLRPIGWWRGFLLIQLMLSLALAPLSLFFFHGTSLSGPLVNLLAVPLFALLTPALLAALLLSLAAPAPGLHALRLVADALAAFRAALDAVAGEGTTGWYAASPAPAALLLAALGIALLFAPRRLPLQPLALLCCVPLFFPPSQAPREGLELTALDVGQGLAVVLRTSHHSLLYDAGPAYNEGFDAGDSIVAPHLLSRGVTALDRMLLSHDHNDHTGGAGAVRRLLRVRDERGAATAQSCRDGERWEWDGVRFELLHPEQDAHWGENNVSCVLRVAVGPHALLLTGDIEKAAEARLLREHAEAVRADVLLAPHHGSKTSSTAAFVEAVRPTVVIHSAGWRHHFRHPHPDVVRRYGESGAAQFVTSQQGALNLRIMPEGISDVQGYRAQAARWWNAPAEALQLEKRPDRLNQEPN